MDMGLDERLEWIRKLGYVMPRKEVLKIFGFLRRREFRYDCQSRWLHFFLTDEISLGFDPQRSVQILDTARCAACGGWKYSVVSVDHYELCRSSRIAKGWWQKEIKLFVSETTASAYIINTIDTIVRIQH